MYINGKTSKSLLKGIYLTGNHSILWIFSLTGKWHYANWPSQKSSILVCFFFSFTEVMIYFEYLLNLFTSLQSAANTLMEGSLLSSPRLLQPLLPPLSLAIGLLRRLNLTFPRLNSWFPWQYLWKFCRHIFHISILGKGSNVCLSVQRRK